MKFVPIPSTHGHYSVSRSGRIRRIKEVKGNHSVGRDLRTQIDRYGYLQVPLCVFGKEKTTPVHRLVAEVFVPNPMGHIQVNHKDGNKLNNHPSNLEWCNAGHNLKHARELGLWKPKRGSQIGTSKLIEDQVRDILSSSETGVAMAKKYGVTVSCISQIRVRRVWKHVCI